ALTKSTSLPKSPLKLVSKASGAAKKAVSPVKTRPPSKAVEELDTSTAAPALPSVQVYDEWGRPRPNTHAAKRTQQPRVPRVSLASGAPPTAPTPTHRRITAAPENAVAQCATLNLKVWEWGSSAVAVGDHVIIVVARPHYSELVSATSISWPTMLSGAMATYTVLYAPFTDYPGMSWSDHYVIANTSAAAPFLAGSSSSSSESSRKKRKRKHHTKHSKHGGKRSGKRHKHSKHSAHKPQRHPTSSSSESGSESDKHGTTTFKDAADRQVVRVKGKAVQTIRVSEPLRAFAPPAHIDAILADVGNEINNYTSINLSAGTTTVYLSNQVSSGRSDRDPSWYTLPAFHDLVWFNQRETNSGIALKVFFFAFDLARCFTPDSLRLFHFLPTVRASQVANAHFKCTRED
ncbi:hypothetical protein B484DRAFT_408466, partial [Ochromonadaceae sp. CCMP2298]